MWSIESLPSICFSCGIFGHLKEACSQGSTGTVSKLTSNNTLGQNKSTVTKEFVAVQNKVEVENYREWMAVNRRQHRQN